MGTIKLPTYQSQQIDQPAGAPARPDLQGMAMLGNAQNRFLETLFGAGEFVAKLAIGAQNQQRADEFSASQRAYKEQLTNTFLEIEKNPISTRDPRYQDIPENERSLPNLSLGAKGREDIYQNILGGIKDEQVKKAFTGWAADRWISEKETLAVKDIGWQKSVGMDYFKQDIGSAIDRGDVGGADDVIANARAAGLINDANVSEYRDLARKDVTKRGAFLTAQGMGEAGMAFLTNPDNLRYTGVDGKPQEMPIADRENLVQRFKDELSWQERQQEVANDNLDKMLSDALLSRKQGKGDPSKWLSLPMIGSAGFQGKTASSHQQYWMDQWDGYIRSTRPSGESSKDPWSNSDPRVVQKLIDLRNDPKVSDTDFKATVRSLTAGDYQGLGRADAEQYYGKERPETPISQAITQIFSKATQGAYPLMAPQESASVRIALDKEIEAARAAKKPYSDTDIQTRVKALMLPYEMANIKARMDKSVSAANQPTEDEKAQYKIWEQAMLGASEYKALQKGGGYVFKGWEGNLQNVEAMQSLIDTGKTFGMVDNPLLKPHIDALRVEYGKMFQTWAGKAPEAEITLTTPKYGGRAVYGIKTLDGQNRLFTVKINPKTNDEEWYLFDPKTDATTLVTDMMKAQLFGGKK